MELMIFMVCLVDCSFDVPNWRCARLQNVCEPGVHLIWTSPGSHLDRMRAQGVFKAALRHPAPGLSGGGVARRTRIIMEMTENRKSRGAGRAQAGE
jgi:hypothetical protein